MMRFNVFITVLLASGFCWGENKTETSLFMKSDPNTYLPEVVSGSGDLWREIGHHGPAIENEWLGLRLYFDRKTAIDVYSKSKPGLELRKTGWYPTAQQQKNGWGADAYKVGRTVGVGGIRLWDGQKMVALHPVSSRSARVVKEGSVSFMEMRSNDVPYDGRKADILVRVTVYSGLREAKVEAFALSDAPVRFVTGINYHKGLNVIQQRNYIATWGAHPEDVAVTRTDVGAAIIYNPDVFGNAMDDGQQHLLVSKPVKFVEFWITSSNSKEKELNRAEGFIEYLDALPFFPAPKL